MKIDIGDSRWGLALLIGLAALAVYANSLANGFALDDVYIVQLNARAHDLSDLERIWLTPYWPFQGQELGLYRPLTIFLFALQWAAAGGDPWVFHAVNIVVHAVVAVLSFLLLERLTNRTAAFVGALIFAVHPVHTEAVANVVGQAELVAAAAMMAGCFLQAGRGPGMAVRWPHRIALVALFGVALAAKESAVVLPALLVLVDFAQKRVPLSVRGLSEYSRAMFMPLFILSTALAFYLIIRFGVMGGSIIGSNAAPAMPFLREEYRLLNALRAFPELLRLLFFPHDLSADYSPAVIMPVEDLRPMVILGTLLLLAVVALACLTPWIPAIGFPAAWFLIGIATVSNLLFPIGVLVAERTLYLPSFAVSALAAHAWQGAAFRLGVSRRRSAAFLLAAICVLMGLRTWTRNPDWRDTNSVWEATYRDNPESYRSQWVRASLMNVAGRTDIAEAHYRLGYRIYSRDTQFTSDFANFLMSRGNYAEALPLLEQARGIRPFTGFTASLLAHAYVATGRYQEALEMLSHADRNGASIVTSMALRAYAFRGMGDQDRAIAAWRVAVQHSTDTRSRAWTFLARSLARGGYPDQAVAAIDSARSAATDSTSLATIDMVGDALIESCYSSDKLAWLVAGFAHQEQLACDPLGEWFDFVPPMHSATSLQNAKIRGYLRPRPGLARNMK